MKAGTWGVGGRWGTWRACVWGLPNVAGTFLPWEVSAAPSGCTWDVDLWDFPSASLNSGRTDANYIMYFAFVSRQLAFPGGPITLFLVSVFLVSSLLCSCKLRLAHSQAQPTNTADYKAGLLLPCGQNTTGSP